MTLAKEILAERRAREGPNLLAFGVTGSVAYGGDGRRSDLDLVVIVRRKLRIPKFRMREGVLVSMSVMAPDEARGEVTGSNPSLPEILSGWRSMRPLYDPKGVMRRLVERAHRVPAAQWRRCAREGMLAAYEDLGKLRNAAEAGDVAKVREMAIWFTGGAAEVLLCLEQEAVPEGRELFVEVVGIGAVGKEIGRLRYLNLGVREAARAAERIWIELRRKARRQRIRESDLP
jgi:hypothetical protein